MSKFEVEGSRLLSLGRGCCTEQTLLKIRLFIDVPSLPGVSARFLFSACPLDGAAGFTDWAEPELHFSTMFNFSSKHSCTSAAPCASSSEQTQEKVNGVNRMHKQAVFPQCQQAARRMTRKSKCFTPLSVQLEVAVTAVKDMFKTK